MSKITSAEIIRLARESDTGADRFSFPVEFLERFAALVADAQREIDAKRCETLWYIDGTRTALEFAAAIRANKE